MIFLNNVSHKFEANWILKDLTLDFKNRKYLIVGPSGSGKTTLLNIVSSLMQPLEGSVKTNKNIGIIFQDFKLLNEFTAQENIEIAMQIQKKTGSYKKIIEMLGIKDIMHKYPDQISGGEKQRVAIARALALEPNFIIADEPTGNLDRNNTLNIIQIFNIIHKELKIGFIVSSHDPCWDSFCDIKLKLNNGTLEEC